MNWPSAKSFLPGWKNALLALLSSILLILAFPDFDLWFLAWFALVPLMWAVERERESAAKSFVLGWLFGTVFFFGTCWWLAYAPIHYAAFPPLLAYSLVLIACLGAGIFPGVFAAVLSVLLRRLGSRALLAAPFVWVFTEFLRYWITGNNWNAIGYSQANLAWWVGRYATIGGVLAVSFVCVAPSAVLVGAWLRLKYVGLLSLPALFTLIHLGAAMTALLSDFSFDPHSPTGVARVIAIQPKVPMSGLTQTKWDQYRRNHVRLAEAEIQKLTTDHRPPTTVIFPESPMNFQYADDPETKAFMDGFARMNNVSVLFNSAEPDRSNGKFFNSAVMVSPEGKELAQYDKIYLLPFGEAVPVPFESIVPAFVGSFSYGKEYDLFPVGNAKAGVMICFESHFGQLSREYVRNGADVIIEMTNDGYLGPTPVLRQHLANAVFRAVETNRPVLRVTNVGITAYINERGEVLDAAQPYTEDTRVWSIARSDGSQTFYLRYGDWFAWLCTFVTLMMAALSFRRKPTVVEQGV
ncbi:MAG: apolipoprotein N-acyltransferase [Pyrinomonadaceae bacterium]|nr:apolipoprotein N-acyltransferase [Pyrinomonadaceae bacterium]